MFKRKFANAEDFVFSLETPDTLGTALSEEAAKKRQRKDAARAIVDDPRNHEPVQIEQVIPNPSPGTVCLKRRANGLDLIPLAQRKNKGGRPRTKIIEINQNYKLRLRKNSPIKANIPLDIWHQIFMQCPPKFLLKARTVHRSWFQALQYESTWVQARKNHYGCELPPPPPGITELQYADLLCGVGCQSRGCTDLKARKTYWGFLRRWCDNCLKRDLVLDKKATEYQKECPRFRECVPAIRVDSWGHYQWVGSHNPRSNYSPGVVRCAYSKMAVEKFLFDYRNFIDLGPEDGPVTEESKTVWLEAKREEAQALTKALEDIEAWEEAERIHKAQHSADKREQRERFFKSKASEIDISALDMEELESFRRAIKISKIPHDRCWEILKPKVCLEYAGLLQLRKEKREKDNRVAAKKAQYVVLETQRTSATTPEQTFVLDLFDDSIRSLRSEKAEIVYADLIPLLLRSVWERYYRLSDDEKPRGPDGEPYSLRMDDFRAIWKLKICPLTLGFGADGVTAALTLKCPMMYCHWHYDLTSRTAGATFNFSFHDRVHTRIDDCPDKMVQHILRYHDEQIWPSRNENDPLYLARCTSDGIEIPYFSLRSERDFPWHIMPWPRNLPILSLYQHVPRWSAHTELEYESQTPEDGTYSGVLDLELLDTFLAPRPTSRPTLDRTMSLGHVINRSDPTSPRSPTLAPSVRTDSPPRRKTDHPVLHRTLPPLEFRDATARSASTSSLDSAIDPSFRTREPEPDGPSALADIR